MSVNIRTGKMFNLTSHFVGHPIPEVRWFKNGKMLPQSDRIVVNFLTEQSGFVHQSEMLVHHSIPSDSGVFQCLMFNQFDAIDVTFFVSTFKPGECLLFLGNSQLVIPVLGFAIEKLFSLAVNLVYYFFMTMNILKVLIFIIMNILVYSSSLS